MEINKNTILITGGSNGIGFEMAKQFLAMDNKVIITGRNEQRLEKAKKELSGLITIVSDVSDSDDINKLYQNISKNYPELNVLINSAGIMSTIDLQTHELSESALTNEIDINLKGTIWMINAFLPLLKKNKNSATVIVSSGLAFVPLAITPVYCASKAALHSYSLSLREQLRNTTVKVFELAPPATETEMMASVDEKYMKGISLMGVEAMVEAFIKGLKQDKLEITPGQTSQLKFMSRFFPNFIFKQLSKSISIMHESQKMS